MNKKAESGTGLTGGQVALLVISVICIIILIYLGSVMIIQYLDKNKAQKGAAELKEILPTLQLVAETKQPKNYSVVYAPEWYLFSTEFADICNPGPFCLCLCKEPQCLDEKARTCVSTQKFVSISAINPLINQRQQTRGMRLDNPPYELKLKYSDQEVYPFSSLTKEERVVVKVFKAEGVIPVFFKFDKEWLWSPDLDNWMPTTTLTVTGGTFNGQTMQTNNFLVESVLKPVKDSKEKGEEALVGLGATKSQGVFLIEA